MSKRKKAPRNNVIRLLEKHNVAYTAYELPAEKLGAQETARRLNVPPERVFKTIVVTRGGRGKPILAVVSAVQEVDLKAVARAVDEKKVALPTQKEAERITGLQAGGISPLALLSRGFTVVLECERAGRGLPAHLRRATGVEHPHGRGRLRQTHPRPNCPHRKAACGHFRTIKKS